MGVDHPSDVRTKVDIVMTTDLLVDLRMIDGIVRLAIAVKKSSTSTTSVPLKSWKSNAAIGWSKG
jgi:hypothetical protein